MSKKRKGTEEEWEAMGDVLRCLNWHFQDSPGIRLEPVSDKAYGKVSEALVCLEQNHQRLPRYENLRR